MNYVNYELCKLVFVKCARDRRIVYVYTYAFSI